LNVLDRLIIFIIISVGLFPADIFLYAQNSKINIAQDLLNNNQLDSLDSYIQPLFKDTLTNDYNKKANLFLFFGKYYDKKNKEEIALKYLNKSEELFLKLNNLEKLAEVHLEKFYLLKSREHLDTKKKISKIFE